MVGCAVYFTSESIMRVTMLTVTESIVTPIVAVLMVAIMAVLMWILILVLLWAIMVVLMTTTILKKHPVDSHPP